MFGLLTLGLAVLGLYSTVFYSVSQRQTEMAIRTALGAQPSDIFATVLRHTAWVAVIGAALGVGAGVALLPLASSIFFGITAVEPGVLGAVALISMALSLTTTYVVARPWTQMASVGSCGDSRSDRSEDAECRTSAVAARLRRHAVPQRWALRRYQ